MAIRLKPFAIAFPAICLAASVSAEININGFASVGGGFYDGDGDTAAFEGFDEDTFSADPINKLGLQFSSPVNEKITATGQLLAKGSNDYNIEAEWAYLTYAVTDDFDLRAGRLRSPFFPYSDFLDVGYAYPWITPPREVYRFDFSTVEGLDMLYRGSLSSWDYTAQIYYGRLTDDISLDGNEVDVDMRNFSGLNVTMNRDWLTLRASYNYANFTISQPSDLALTALNAALIANGFSSVADALAMEDENGQFLGLSAQIDYNDWLLNTEYTELLVSEQSLISDDSAYYVMLGKRIGSLTLHATYSRAKSDIDESIIDSIPNAGAGAVLRAGVLSAIPNVDTAVYTLGTRWDFASGTALKVEVSDIEYKATKSDGTLVAFAIDTVF